MNSSICFAGEIAKKTKPVEFPPGRASVLTKPCATGSVT